MHRQQFTSESVTEGHPDKVCDRISDTVLDAMLEQDPSSRVAIETMATTGLIHVAGEVTTSSYVEIPRLVRQTIDRSAAYAARWAAKNVVASGLAERCELQVAYAIGRAHPLSVRVDTFGTETAPVERIESAVTKVFDLRPAAIIEELDLKRPIYAATSAYGHFGREGFAWERADRVDELLRAV